MLRQNANPMNYQTTRRPDNASILTTGRAGEVIPITAGPLLRGDSASGRIDIEAQLAEMPKPLENLVVMRAQAWVVPRPAFPQFESPAEYNHSYEGSDITKLGASSRTPPSLFSTVGTGAIAAAQSSELFRALGLNLVASTAINTDYIDAYVLIQNFRLAAHSSKLTRYDYYAENATTALQLKPAFWPLNRMHQIVADYESALVQGALELDVSAGSLPVTGLGADNTTADGDYTETGGGTGTYTDYLTWTSSGGGAATNNDLKLKMNGALEPAIYAEIANQTITTSLADIDKARVTEAMAKARAAYAGTNFSGFNLDDVIVSTLMQGFDIPEEALQRPILLDSKTTVFGMTERHATDAANLDDSSSTGMARVSLSINIPRMKFGGVYMATVEVMPERLFERQQDPYLYVTGVDALPNALRDVQNTLPVDTVSNARVDTAHTTPTGTFGYEPMNAKWRRDRTTLGGDFRQTTPGTPITTARTAIWQPDIVDQGLTADHWVCPHPFPQDVFSAPSSDCVTLSVTQTVTVTGITQFGDDLVEDNGEFLDTAAEA